jgi:Superinfection immunity protein
MNTLIALALITILITAATVAYFLPTLIARLRHSPDLTTVMILNLLLGWTAAGWIVALILAVRRTAPAIQIIGQVNGHIPAIPWPPAPGGRAVSQGSRADTQPEHTALPAATRRR